MMRTVRLLSLIAALAVGRLAAQGAGTRTVPHAAWRRASVHYGKWLTAAAAATFTAMGAHEHANSSRVFGQLLDLCRADNQNCVLAPNGAYRDPTAEALYQTSIHYDRRARVRLLAGQVGLLGTAALFLADLHHATGEPGNIPFHGAELTVMPQAGGAQVGVRLTLP